MATAARGAVATLRQSRLTASPRSRSRRSPPSLAFGLVFRVVLGAGLVAAPGAERTASRTCVHARTGGAMLAHDEALPFPGWRGVRTGGMQRRECARRSRTDGERGAA